MDFECVVYADAGRSLNGISSSPDIKHSSSQHAS